MNSPRSHHPACAGESEMLWNVGDRSRWIHPCHWGTTAGMSQLALILQGTLVGTGPQGVKSTCPFLHPPLR